MCRISQPRPHFQRTDVQFFFCPCVAVVSFVFLLIEDPALALCVDDLRAESTLCQKKTERPASN